MTEEWFSWHDHDKLYTVRLADVAVIVEQHPNPGSIRVRGVENALLMPAIELIRIKEALGIATNH